jgi:hypothetical protein
LEDSKAFNHLASSERDADPDAGGEGWAKWARSFGSIQYTAGDRYEGLLVDGQLDGTGMYTWADGSRYNGMFAMGQRDGRGTFVTHESEMFFGEFVEVRSRAGGDTGGSSWTQP